MRSRDFLPIVALVLISAAPVIGADIPPLPAAEAPLDFSGDPGASLAKHSQYIASVKYQVATQLEYIRKVDDPTTRLAHCQEYLEEALASVQPNGKNVAQLRGLLPAIERDIVSASNRLEHARGDIVTSTDAEDQVLSVMKKRAETLARVQAEYSGLSKMLADIQKSVSNAVSAWELAKTEASLRAGFNKKMTQIIDAWSTWCQPSDNSN